MSSGKTVLIVDDSSFMRMLLKDIVTGMGHKVVAEADNGADAVKLYDQFKPDLVTMDMVMPKASGVQGIQGIMKVNRKACIVVVSAIDQRESLIEAIQLGASDFIVKP